MCDKICFSISGGGLFPERIPNSGELIEIMNGGYPFQSIVVDDDWSIKRTIQAFDALIFVHKGDEIIFQVRPTEKRDIGVLVFNKRTRLQNNGFSRNWYAPSIRNVTN